MYSKLVITATVAFLVVFTPLPPELYRIEDEVGQWTQPAIDSELSMVLSQSPLQTYQTDYTATHQIYWQGIGTHSVLPRVGNPAPVENGKARNHEVGWLDTSLLPNTIIDYRLHLHTTRSGYSVMIWALLNGQRWVRRLSFDPLVSSLGWAVLDES